MAECGSTWIIIVIDAPGGSQTTAWNFVSAEYIRYRISTIIACLAHQKNGIDTTDFFEWFYIDDISNVKDNNDFAVACSQFLESIDFFLTKFILAWCDMTVGTFPGIAGDHKDCSVCFCCVDILALYRHHSRFNERMAEQIHNCCHSALLQILHQICVIGIEFFLHIGTGAVDPVLRDDFKSGCFQTFFHIYNLSGIDTSGTGTATDRAASPISVQCDLTALCKRQCTVVF